MSTSEEPNPEILQAIFELTVGATLLKAGRSGSPHFRRFRLTHDLTRLTWESSKKSDRAVLISQITELKIGQTTTIFKKNPLPEHASRSFSLLYSGRSLDVVCKDSREFEVWTTGLQALINGFNNLRAVEAFLSQHDKKRLTVSDDRLKVHFGTFRTTAVAVTESACDLYTWGSGARGMLGHKDEDNEKQPRVVESLLGRDINMVACGMAHTMALSATGEVFSWGSGSYGRLGHGNIRDRFSPLMIGVPLRGVDITHVACHEFHSAAVSDDGRLFTWGRAGPQLGYEVKEGSNKQLRPHQVEDLADYRVTQVACGIAHTLACTDDSGKVYAFGTNKFGELGLGHCNPVTMPTAIPSLRSIYKVAAGRNHSASVDVDGILFLWGWGQRGQLGQGESKNLSEPAPVETFSDLSVSDISCGDGHTCALTANGIAYCWGDNSVGQLGTTHSSYTEISKPRAVLTPTGQQIVQIACGANFTVALSNLGTVFTWGQGTSGQLAHGDNKGRAQPVEVEALSGKQVRLVACGLNHMACTVVHGWVPDEEAKACMACKKGFTPIRRRHHCRKCGGVYCGACSTKRFPLLMQGYSDPVRVCGKCYTTLTKDS